MILAALSFLVIAGALALSRVGAATALGERMTAWEAPLRKRGPVLVALISIAVVWFTWGEVVPTPKVHDENSYLLQADIFARFRWTAPSPPIPEFWEQPHVQTEPALASKYPPGHALLLSLGAMVGFAALVPLLLAGLTAELVFLLAVRLTDAWRGLLTWLVWLTAPLVLRFQPSYFSETTTAPLVLVSWWLLLNWREDHRLKWLLAMALAIGWGAITRPLTMLAFAIPIGVVVIRDTIRMRKWRDLAAAMVLGTAVLAILPLWSAKTTGDWRVSPVEKYRLDYLPFDKIGFAVDSSAPRVPMATPMQSTYEYFLEARTSQTLAAAPQTAAERLLQVVIGLFQNVRLPLLLFAVVGLALATGPVRFGLVSTAVLFLAHLPYAHLSGWTVYYLEAAPVAAVLVAIGAGFVVRKLANADAAARGTLGFVTLSVAVFAGTVVAKWKEDHRIRSEFDRRFAAQLRKLPSSRAIVFMTYSTRFKNHVNEVFNYADLESVPVWVVHDLGARNDELRKLAPDRMSFDFDEGKMIQGTGRP